MKGKKLQIKNTATGSDLLSHHVKEAEQLLGGRLNKWFSAHSKDSFSNFQLMSCKLSYQRRINVVTWDLRFQKDISFYEFHA